MPISSLQQKQQQQQFQPVQISLSPSQIITLTIPNNLQQQFTITNLTLRPVIIYPIISHQDELFVTGNNQIQILQAFQEHKLKVGLKSITFPIGQFIRGKLRVYIWEVKNFTDEDQVVLERDQELLAKGEGDNGENDINRRNKNKKNTSYSDNQQDYIYQYNEHNYQQLSQQQFIQYINCKQIKQSILQKYKHKMFSLQNISQKSFIEILSRNKHDYLNRNIKEKKRQGRFNNDRGQRREFSNGQQCQQQQHDYNNIYSDNDQYQQQSFSQLIYKQYAIQIKVDNHLIVTANNNNNIVNTTNTTIPNIPSQKQLYLIQNIIQPSSQQQYTTKIMTEQQKRLQLQLIQKKLFMQTQHLGKVKAIDRLSPVVMKNNDKINKYINKNSSIYSNKGNNTKMKSLGLISSDDNNNSDDIESVRIKPMGMNRSMEYNVIVAQQRKVNLSMERYLIEYKQPIMQQKLLGLWSQMKNYNDNSKVQTISFFPMVLGCKFIQIVTQRNYYLFRMSKILSYDYNYNSSERGGRQNQRKYSSNNSNNSIMDSYRSEINNYNRRITKNNKLPVIIDLNNVDISEWRRSKRQRSQQQRRIVNNDNIDMRKVISCDDNNVEKQQLQVDKQKQLVKEKQFKQQNMNLLDNLSIDKGKQQNRNKITSTKQQVIVVNENKQFKTKSINYQQKQTNTYSVIVDEVSLDEDNMIKQQHKMKIQVDKCHQEIIVKNVQQQQQQKQIEQNVSLLQQIKQTRQIVYQQQLVIDKYIQDKLNSEQQKLDSNKQYKLQSSELYKLVSSEQCKLDSELSQQIDQINLVDKQNNHIQLKQQQYQHDKIVDNNNNSSIYQLKADINYQLKVDITNQQKQQQNRQLQQQVDSNIIIKFQEKYHQQRQQIKLQQSENYSEHDKNVVVVVEQQQIKHKLQKQLQQQLIQPIESTQPIQPPNQVPIIYKEQQLQQQQYNYIQQRQNQHIQQQQNYTNELNTELMSHYNNLYQQLNTSNTQQQQQGILQQRQQYQQQNQYQDEQKLKSNKKEQYYQQQPQQKITSNSKQLSQPKLHQQQQQPQPQQYQQIQNKQQTQTQHQQTQQSKLSTNTNIYTILQHRHAHQYSQEYQSRQSLQQLSYLQQQKQQISKQKQQNKQVKSPKKKQLVSQSFSHPQIPNPIINPPPKYTQQLITYQQPILSCYISNPTQTNKQSFIYLLFRTHLLIFPINNNKQQQIIKLDPMKQTDIINYKTILTPYINKTTLELEEIIIANGCYIYWISLLQKQSQWKYCQRKQIYCLQVIEQMGLLAVGGKNFSKLSYFGKQTSRSNIKIYTCGKVKQRNHLFTYDIPINQHVGNVMQLKYITTPPTGGKLLCAYTNYNDQYKRLLFLRIRAYNVIEMYGNIQLNQIGIQSILSMKYNFRSMKLLVLEQVDAQHTALKKLKIKSMYEKVQVLTECINTQIGNYATFEIGGDKDIEWYSLVNKQKNSGLIYRNNKFHHNPQLVEMKKTDIQTIYDVEYGEYVFIKGFDFVMVKKRKKFTQQNFK